MSPAGVYLARHGQTAYNLEGRFQGQQQIPLDDTGRAQAAELAERAVGYGFAALWCSPLLRARETADVVAARIGLEPKEDARLMETDAGDWTDRSFADVRAECAASSSTRSPPATRPSRFPAASPSPSRRSASRGSARCRGGALPALVVCHGMVIRAALASRGGRSRRALRARAQRRARAAGSGRGRARRARRWRGHGRELSSSLSSERSVAQRRITQPVRPVRDQLSSDSTNSRPSAVAVRLPRCTTRPSASTRPVASLIARM